MVEIAVQRRFAYIGPRQIGKIIVVEFGMYYVDVCRHPHMRTQRVFLFIDDRGDIEAVAEGMMWRNKYYIKSEAEGIPPSTNLWDYSIIASTPQATLEEAFKRAKEVLEQTVVFKDAKLYDLVTAWCMYTWLRGLFPKNINLYFIGFPNTGKSQALKYCKLFSRYPVDYDPTAEKSYKWAVSHTLGVLSIDEAEYISKVTASKLRKYHETDVVESRVIGLPVIGLATIDLRVDAPIILASTHPPPDIAFLQRGFIIRMVKGTPEVKDFDFIPMLEETRYIVGKTMLTSWRRVFESLNTVYTRLMALDVDERVKDLATPICTILEAIGENWDWVIDYAKYSFNQANFVTPETTAFIQALNLIRSNARVVDGKYVMPMRVVHDILYDVGRTIGANPSKLAFLKQYLFAGCEVEVMGGELVYIADKHTVDSVVENMALHGERSPTPTTATSSCNDETLEGLAETATQYLSSKYVVMEGVYRVPLLELGLDDETTRYVYELMRGRYTYTIRRGVKLERDEDVLYIVIDTNSWGV